MSRRQNPHHRQTSESKRPLIEQEHQLPRNSVAQTVLTLAALALVTDTAKAAQVSGRRVGSSYPPVACNVRTAGNSELDQIFLEHAVEACGVGASLVKGETNIRGEAQVSVDPRAVKAFSECVAEKVKAPVKGGRCYVDHSLLYSKGHQPKPEPKPSNAPQILFGGTPPIGRPGAKQAHR